VLSIAPSSRAVRDLANAMLADDQIKPAIDTLTSWLKNTRTMP
jgi:hypothetical protein